MPNDARYDEAEVDLGKASPMHRYLCVLIACFGLLMWSPAEALESGATCDIEDDAVQPDVLKDLERILRELSTATS